ncbi:MAG TPA: DUF1735 domain-containing protein, partial [Phyllobacterium sp.]|nr:DUF1735 domain-containing protein [Phyllobacterium sp.]
MKIHFRALIRNVALAFCLLFVMQMEAYAEKLVLVNLRAQPTSLGSGQGKRVVFSNAGTVGSVSVDLVAKVVTGVLDHNFAISGGRPSIFSAGLDTIWVDWYIYRAGTYKLATDSGGEPVAAEVMVQFNDIDGPNLEQLYIPLCAPPVQFARVAKASTLIRK